MSGRGQYAYTQRRTVKRCGNLGYSANFTRALLSERPTLARGVNLNHLSQLNFLF